MRSPAIFATSVPFSSTPMSDDRRPSLLCAKPAWARPTRNNSRTAAARLGMQVMLEDYVQSSANKFAVFAALNLATFGGAAFGLVCVIRLALGGA